jgi:hypothetical protein
MEGIGPNGCLSWSQNRLGITSIHVWNALPTLNSQLATMPFRYSLPFLVIPSLIRHYYAPTLIPYTAAAAMESDSVIHISSYHSRRKIIFRQQVRLHTARKPCSTVQIQTSVD